MVFTADSTSPSSATHGVVVPFDAAPKSPSSSSMTSTASSPSSSTFALDQSFGSHTANPFRASARSSHRRYLERRDSLPLSGFSSLSVSSNSPPASPLRSQTSSPVASPDAMQKTINHIERKHRRRSGFVRQDASSDIIAMHMMGASLDSSSNTNDVFSSSPSPTHPRDSFSSSPTSAFRRPKSASSSRRSAPAALLPAYDLSMEPSDILKRNHKQVVANTMLRASSTCALPQASFLRLPSADESTSSDGSVSPTLSLSSAPRSCPSSPTPESRRGRRPSLFERRQRAFSVSSINISHSAPPKPETLRRSLSVTVNHDNVKNMEDTRADTLKGDRVDQLFADVLKLGEAVAIAKHDDAVFPPAPSNE